MKTWTRESLKSVVEAMIFASPSPISLSKLAQAIENVSLEFIKEAISTLMDEYAKDHRGIELVQVADGYRFQTRPEYGEWVRRASRKTVQKLSRAALETLAVIAYKQPITRAEIERTRGVDSSGTIRLLLSKNLIRISGRKDVPGRPLLYRTTSRFLEVFQLKSLKDLPGIKELDSGLEARQTPLFDKKAV